VLRVRSERRRAGVRGFMAAMRRKFGASGGLASSPGARRSHDALSMLVRRDHLAMTAVLCTTAAVAACGRRSPSKTEPPRASLAAQSTTPAHEPSATTTLDSADLPIACGSLRDVTTSDLVRVADGTLFYADSTAGLTLVDVVDPTHPHVLGTVRFVGTPVALFVREGVAWLVFVDWDPHFAAGVESVVRAVDVRDPRSPRILGDEAREGVARDAKLVGDVLYVLRRDGEHSTLESFGTNARGMRPLASLSLPGAPAQLAASPAGLAVITDRDGDPRPAPHATVSWIDLPLDGGGGLLLRDAVTVAGSVATWERGDAEIVDADEGQTVRVVTCAAPACAPTGGATLRRIDFAAAEPALTVASLRVSERGGLPVTRFADGFMYVADPSDHGGETSVVHVVRTGPGVPAFAAHVAVRGEVAGLVAHDASVIALGTISSRDSRVQVIVQELAVDGSAPPRVRASVALGSDWTWSAALDDERALAFDPRTSRMALPVTMWHEAGHRYVTGAEVVRLGGREPHEASAFATEGFVERTVFVDGVLVALGPERVQVIDRAAAEEPAPAQR
jgi:hypothetical protein